MLSALPAHLAPAPLISWTPAAGWLVLPLGWRDLARDDPHRPVADALAVKLSEARP